jgi:hypothetical protein
LYPGTAAVITVYILQLPALNIIEVGNAIEWAFFILLPNYCFNKALQDLYSNYQYGSACRTIDDFANRTVYCQVIAATNKTNPCCPSTSLSDVFHRETRINQ